jgi:hypothetical protein
MNFSKLITLVFGIAFIIILYFIIYYALKIMYKDVKGGGRRKSGYSENKNYGIELLSAGDNSNLEEGTLLLLRENLSIGRREGNTIRLEDQYVSGNHARILVKNKEVIIEDLNSTNGVFVNDQRINNSYKLRANDKIKIGTAIFKVIRAEKN